jgi:hypothetical protein
MSEDVTPEKPKKLVHGVSRSLLLTQEQDARLEKLLAATGLNRNQFVRICAEKMKPSDMDKLRDR